MDIATAVVYRILEHSEDSVINRLRQPAAEIMPSTTRATEGSGAQQTGRCAVDARGRKDHGALWFRGYREMAAAVYGYDQLRRYHGMERSASINGQLCDRRRLSRYNPAYPEVIFLSKSQSLLQTGGYGMK